MAYSRKQQVGRTMAQESSMMPMVTDDGLTSNNAAYFAASMPGYQYASAGQPAYYPVQGSTQSASQAYQYQAQYPATTYSYYTPSSSATAYATASPFEMANSIPTSYVSADSSLVYDTGLASSMPDDSMSNSDMSQFGTLNPDGTWKCNYPGCSSEAIIRRACDLRKHHKRHIKTLFCRYPNCAQSEEIGASEGGGFSTKKDRERHERSHEPNIRCEYPGCDKVGSRADNMRDHYRRRHGQK